MCTNDKIYSLTDLNENNFNQSVVFSTDEIRSFIYILTPKDPNYKINKFQTEILGQLEIKWFNYMGD